jgi:hypothetical protein
MTILDDFFLPHSFNHMVSFIFLVQNFAKISKRGFLDCSIFWIAILLNIFSPFKSLELILIIHYNDMLFNY